MADRDVIAPELLTDARDVLVMAAAIVLAWWLRAPAMLVVAWLAGRRRRDTGWWSNRNLTTALIQAGILKPPTEGRLNLSYRGAPRKDDDGGTTVTVALPQAVTLTVVLARREPLAAALRVPLALLEVTQDPKDPANAVTIRVGTGDVAEVPSVVTDAARTTWSDPVRIGRDSRGRPVFLATVEENTIVGGIPGAGKTSGVVQPILGHYLLDPSTSIYALDGKGSRRDYAAARPLCTRFVSGRDRDAVADTLTMLEEVLDIVQARNDSELPDHPGLLLLLEEFQDIRAAASKPEREALDVCLGRVTRMGRAVSTHVLIATQRPSVEDLPSGTRNLLSQGVALRVRDGQDAKLVLGSTPTLPLPRHRGQALLATAAGTRAVTLDRLTEDAWRGLCARSAALRATNTPTPPWDMGKPSEPSQGILEAPVALPDPLLEAVLEVLYDADPAGIPATTLHAALPDWHEFVPTPQALGAELRRHEEVERVYRGSSRVWRLSERCRSSVGEVSVGVGGPRPEVSVPTPTDTLEGPVRAQAGASDSAGVKAARAGSTRP